MKYKYEKYLINVMYIFIIVREKTISMSHDKENKNDTNELFCFQLNIV